MLPEKIKLKVLITVKTYPIPSSRYEELVCTAGVNVHGDFVRLYPINFRDLAYDRQYKKYQWIEVDAEKHKSDPRKESYRPICETLQCVGKPIQSNPGNWSERAKYALAKKAQSIETLRELQDIDHTSLGVIKPKLIRGLEFTSDEEEWKEGFIEALKQMKLFEKRHNTLTPPRKVPFRFHYEFLCDDGRCKGHRMMIEDWEVGALFWNLVDKGANYQEAARKVRYKFFEDICGPQKDTHFFVGTVAAHPKSWVVLGTFYPTLDKKGFVLEKSKPPF
jgi:hypothetical protein